MRFTANALGTIDPASGGRVAFTEHTVGEGDTGIILANMGAMPEGWLRVKPDAYPSEFVPVHPGMIEAVTE
ncbi:MAG TPA: hypothetical protein VNC18_17590 [Gemmatimonadaceae bacterium]|nr:hypothetical protein [Gemmatimonadaceae bacterium]